MLPFLNMGSVMGKQICYLKSEKRINWIKEELLKSGLLYKDGDLLNLKEKLFVECIYCGELRYVSFKNRAAYGCRKRAVTNTRDVSTQQLSAKVANLGYTIVLSENYKNANKTKFTVACKNGHTRETTYRNLVNHPICQECFKEEALVKKCAEIRKNLTALKYTVHQIQPKKYASNTQYFIKATCQNGHEFNKIYSTYTSECALCTPIRLWNFESICYWLSENMPHLRLLNYDLSSKRASFECSIDGYMFATDFAKFKSAGSNCPKCSKSAKLTKDEVIQIYADKNYQIEIDEKVTTRDKILTTCPEGHKFISNIIRFRDRGDRCPECQRKSQASRGEREFADWLEGMGYAVIRNDRNALDGLEIDCYLPDFKIGIEYNGLYYHSSARSIKKNTHHAKYKRAITKGIKLFQFWEDEFITKLDILKSMLLVELGHVSIKRLYAVNCIVKDIDRETAKYFLEQNHLQGYKGTSRLGLYHNEELVMALTYGNNSAGETGGIVLQRLATLKNTYVIDGLSELLKYIPRPILHLNAHLLQLIFHDYLI